MNGYICFYKNKRIEVYAATSYEAQQKAVAAFKARRAYDVTAVLVNGYICFYKGKRIEVRAATPYEAQQKAVAAFKARRAYDVTVVLAEIDGQQVTHSTGGL